MIKKNSMEQYLVEIFLPEFTEEFFELVPAQREYIDKCLSKGLISSYSLAADRSKLWVVFTTASEVEMSRTLNRFPIIKWITYKIYPLMFHNSKEMLMPAISLN
jgi:muconolactone delta-isomerase